MDYDTILDEIGGFGKFQIKILMLVCLPVLYGAANSLSYIFTARKPPYRCFVSECEQFESTKYSQDWMQNALPGSLSNGKFLPEGCYKYNIIQNINDTELTRNNTCFADLFGLEREKCNSWIFSSDEVTIVNDWPTELTCTDNQWKLAFAGTANFAGVMIGSAIFGFLADYYGRRKIFIISIMFMSLSGIGQAVSSSYLMFLIFTFLNAAGTAGIYFSAFILVIEIIDKNKREMSAVLLNYFYSFGGVLIGLTAYFDRNWRNLICWLSFPPILFIFFYRLIPESVCWLISNKLHSNAYKIVKKAAKANNKELSISLTSQFEGNFIIERKIPIDESEKIEKPENATYAAMFRSKILMVRILILCILWGTNALVFYGLSLNSVNLSGNIYYNFIFGSLIEIPGTTIAWISMNKIGRRYPLVFSFLICGVGCIWGAFSDNEAILLETLSFLISKMAISTSFTITTVYTAEMMPTNMRSGAVGTLSTVARLTSLLAPFIPLLKTYYSFLPLTVFGSFALVAGFLSLILPETLGCDLPDTICEAEEMGA
ncbi:organic cation/carnitine transporter 2-like [Chironomus tepperi]|uniref:organic cation/carnitine transporter 2-like n=1 Tax=Chironomus tepperi TaxID=113505 RepID=UPI00391F280E